MGAAWARAERERRDVFTGPAFPPPTHKRTSLSPRPGYPYPERRRPPMPSSG
jgi:hypothetical protein